MLRCLQAQVEKQKASEPLGRRALVCLFVSSKMLLSNGATSLSLNVGPRRHVDMRKSRTCYCSADQWTSAQRLLRKRNPTPNAARAQVPYLEASSQAKMHKSHTRVSERP